jgi:phenylacetate-CoA ligase
MRRSRAWLIRNLLLPSTDLVLGHPMMRRVRFLRQAQWWDVGRIRSVQCKLVQETIRTAYESTSFYRELMRGARLRPEDIRTPEDLRYIPAVTKQMLRDAYPHGVTRPVRQKCYETRTSGSTGTNFTVLEDANTAAWYRASFLLALEWAGWTVGEPHLQNGIAYPRSWQKRAKDFCVGCHYVSAYSLSDRDLDATLQILERKRIEHLWGYPGSLYTLARRAAQLGWNMPMKTVVTWGDILYPAYRRAIEAAFRATVRDTYGCGEGIQIAAQCGAEGGVYHRHDLDVIVDFEAPASNWRGGEPAAVVLTRLHAGPMPLIRYRVGDLAVEGDRQPCTCGRGFSTLHSIQGRETDIITTPSGNRLIVHFFTGILEHFREIESFHAIQEEPGLLRVLIVPTGTLAPEGRRRIVDAIRNGGAGDMTIRLELVTEIPVPPSGKRRFVTSRVAAEQHLAPAESAGPGTLAS